MEFEGGTPPSGAAGWAHAWGGFVHPGLRFLFSFFSQLPLCIKNIKNIKRLGFHKPSVFTTFTYSKTNSAESFSLSPENFLLTKPLHKLNNNISVRKNNKPLG